MKYFHVYLPNFIKETSATPLIVWEHENEWLILSCFMSLITAF